MSIMSIFEKIYRVIGAPHCMWHCTLESQYFLCHLCKHSEQNTRADSRLAPSQWATALLCNDVSHWLGASLGSTLNTIIWLEQAEPWWRASIWRSHRKVVIKQCSYHNNIIDIQNRLPYSKVVYPAIIVIFSCLMEVNHGVRTGPDYPFR